MKNLFLFLLLLLFSSAVPAQEWDRSYPGYGGGVYTYRLIPMPDGGFLVSATSNALIGSRVFTKLSANGDIEWTKDQKDVLGFRVWDMIPTKDGNLLFAGCDDALGLQLRETTGDFETVWSTTFPPSLHCGLGLPVLKHAPDGYMLALIKADLNFMRLDYSGKITSQFTFDLNLLGTDFERIEDISVDSFGQVYIGGVEDWPFPSVLAKLSPTGDLIFRKGYAGSDLAYGYSSLILNGNADIIATNNINVIQFKTNGDILKTIPVRTNFILQTSDGNYLGSHKSLNDGKYNLIKFDLNGTILWQKKGSVVLPPSSEIASFWPLPGGEVVVMLRPTASNGYDFYIYFEAGVLSIPGNRHCRDMNCE